MSAQSTGTMRAFGLSGKTALVTGGSGGIGLAIARALAASGAGVAIAARDKRRLKHAAEKIGAQAFACDLSATDCLEEFYARVSERMGGLDILVNNAGTTLRGPSETIEPGDWDLVLRTNLTSVFRLCQFFARERIAHKKTGKIINIASLLCESVRQHNAPYAAAKGGIRQLTKALAVDWAKYRINVNAIGPGYVKTALTKPLHENRRFDRWVKQRTPMGRWGRPEDVAGAAVFLAGPASDFITGQVIYVDGGFLSSL